MQSRRFETSPLSRYLGRVYKTRLIAGLEASPACLPAQPLSQPGGLQLIEVEGTGFVSRLLSHDADDSICWLDDRRFLAEG
ncbi:unnamed protein product [Protopolystoma xenopodis]|uniref:Uncharacterized protein n=1 Tax=Protopolystoma xenopodis TaxID=117903 RepID=A0A448XJ59_9PLAT|nr:unnamed protein product [Protopolystoma xenopodis]